LDNGQPPLFLPPHLAGLGSQFTPPLFSNLKGKQYKFLITKEMLISSKKKLSTSNVLHTSNE
jgi:hypothetical protein